MTAKRTHVVLSAELVKEIDTLVGTRQRNNFISEAVEKELMRRRQIAALNAAAGAWKAKDHSELKQGSVKWVRKLRRESEKRFQKAAGR